MRNDTLTARLSERAPSLPTFLGRPGPRPRPRARPPLAKKLVLATPRLLAEVPVLRLRPTEHARRPAGTL